LDIYGEKTIIDGIESNSKNNNRVDVYADDVIVKNSVINNDDNWGMVVRNNRVRIENTHIRAKEGMYLDSNSRGHRINNSNISSRGIDMEHNNGVSNVTISNTILSSDNSHVITNNGGGGELKLNNVTIDGPNGLSLNRNTDVQLQQNIEFVDGAQNSLSSLFLANPDDTETVLTDKIIENKQSSFTIITNTNDYNRVDINGNNQIYNVQHENVTFGYSKIYGKNNTIDNGLYYSPNEHSIEIYGADNTIKNTDMHNKNSWGIVIRSHNNTIENNYIRARRGVYVDSNLDNNIISTNEMDVNNDNGINYKSGSTGLIEYNTIINGNPAINSANADVENNTIE
jgi:hypothetical protein